MEDRRIAWVAPHSEHFTRQTLSRRGPKGVLQSACSSHVWRGRQRGRRTGQLMKGKVINNRIIKGLRNLIAIPDKNGYHSLVNVHR